VIDSPRRSGRVVGPGSAELRELLEAIGAGAFARERDGVAPHEAFDRLRRSGFGAFRVARELGGAGASHEEYFQTIIELAVVDPNVAHAVRSHFIFLEPQLPAFAAGEHAKWLELVLAGAIFGIAHTELNTQNTGGFDPDRFDTTLVPDGDGYRLSGEKFYATGSLYADWVAVTARSGDAVLTAVVPVDREGVSIADDWDGMGQQLTASGGARFDGVRVSADEIIRRRADAPRAETGGAFAQLHLTAVVAGILQAAVNDAVTMLRNRSRTFVHGAAASPTDDPLLQHVIGVLAANAFAARSVTLAAAATLARASAPGVLGSEEAAGLGDLARIEAAEAKITVDALAQSSGWQIFDVGGASATRRGLNLDRHWRNARTIASHNPDIYKTRAIGDYLVNASALPSVLSF
jgi:alkylation response protein AidB-like acyl-CoA dehydrogenase